MILWDTAPPGSSSLRLVNVATGGAVGLRSIGLVEGAKFLTALLWVGGVVAFLAGSFVAPVFYVVGAALLVVAVAFTVDVRFGPTTDERHRMKLETIRSARVPSHQTTWPMTPMKERLVALAAIVIADEEEERLERIRRTGFVGEIKVTGRDLTTGLPATGSVATADLWPPDDGLHGMAPNNA